VATHDVALAREPVRLRAGGRRWGEEAVRVLLALCAFVSVLTTLGIVVALLEPSIDF
jgi:ABC-type phosphate transport system permease subunit